MEFSYHGICSLLTLLVLFVDYFQQSDFLDSACKKYHAKPSETNVIKASGCRTFCSMEMTRITVKNYKGKPKIYFIQGAFLEACIRGGGLCTGWKTKDSSCSKTSDQNFVNESPHCKYNPMGLHRRELFGPLLRGLILKKTSFRGVGLLQSLTLYSHSLMQINFKSSYYIPSCNFSVTGISRFLVISIKIETHRKVCSQQIHGKYQVELVGNNQISSRTSAPWFVSACKAFI